MTDTPAESAEDPRTPEQIAEPFGRSREGAARLLTAIRAALAARDALWREAVNQSA